MNLQSLLEADGKAAEVAALMEQAGCLDAQLALSRGLCGMHTAPRGFSHTCERDAVASARRKRALKLDDCCLGRLERGALPFEGALPEGEVRLQLRLHGGGPGLLLRQGSCMTSLHPEQPQRCSGRKNYNEEYYYSTNTTKTVLTTVLLQVP